MDNATINQSLTQFWGAKGKSDARDGKPQIFILSQKQADRYTGEEKEIARMAYNTGYMIGLPEGTEVL